MAPLAEAIFASESSEFASEYGLRYSGFASEFASGFCVFASELASGCTASASEPASEYTVSASEYAASASEPAIADTSECAAAAAPQRMDDGSWTDERTR